MLTRIKIIFSNTLMNIRCFKTVPFNSGSSLINTFMVVLSIAIAFVSFVLFVSSGGYENQMNILSGYEDGELFSTYMWNSYKKALPCLIVCLVLSVIITIVGEMKLQDTCSFKTILYGAIVTFVLTPIALVLVENVLPLALLLIAIGVGVFLLKGSSEIPKDNKPIVKKSEDKPKKDYRKTVELDLNTVFWVDTDIIGCRCIYYKNAWGQKSNACSVYEFEKGEVVIKNGKGRVTYVPGCKSPEK